jgi:hypothetical protein
VSLCLFTFADGRKCHQTMPALTHLNATLTNASQVLILKNLQYS